MNEAEYFEARRQGKNLFWTSMLEKLIGPPDRAACVKIWTDVSRIPRHGDEPLGLNNVDF